MTVRREIVPIGQAMGASIGARGNSGVSDRKSSPLASGHLPFAKKLAIAAEAFMARKSGDEWVRRALRSFSEGGLRATESSAFLLGCPARERRELHLMATALTSLNVVCPSRAF